jgi:hypothetical protein
MKLLVLGSTVDGSVMVDHFWPLNVSTRVFVLLAKLPTISQKEAEVHDTAAPGCWLTREAGRVEAADLTTEPETSSSVKIF